MGTFLHWLAHSKMILEDGARGDIGAQPPMPPGIELNAWIAQFYLRTVREIVPADWSLECEVALEHSFARFTLTGHIDCVAMSPDATEAIIFDLKSGYDPVDPAEENEQVLGYTVELKMAYESLRKISGYIVQPRNDEDEGLPRVSPPMILEGDALDAAVAGFEARVNDALDKPMELESSKKACRWCSVSVQCPALQKEQQLMKHTLTKEELSRVKAVPDDALLGDWVIAGRTLRQPTEDATELLRTRIKERGYVDAGGGTRITIKTSRGSYKVVDPQALWQSIKGLLSEARMAASAKWSMTTLKDSISEELGCPKTGKAQVTSETVFAQKVAPFVEQGERDTFIFT